MGKRGPRPLPGSKAAALRARRNETAPKPRAGVPPCPDWLDDVAKEKYAQLAPELEQLGLLTSIDGDALAGYCQAWAEFKVATETLQREGRTFTTSTGYLAPHPAVAQQRSAWAAMQKFSSVFGLDPGSRARLVADPPALKNDEAQREKEEFERFLRGEGY